ncbi:MAG: diacylglycerol kinase family protein [Planctomycetota bacterium]
MPSDPAAPREPDADEAANRSAKPRRLLLIANPIAGGGRGRKLAPELSAALQRQGVHGEVYFTQRAGDGGERARLAADEEYDGIVVLGGDGTVNEVLNGMPHLRMPLGVLPLGTANVLALEAKLPRDVDAAAAVFAAGHQRELAVGTCNGRRFLLFVGVGIDGAMVRRLSEVRTGTLGKHKWLGPVLHTAWHWPRVELAVELADGTVLDGLSSVLVTRSRGYGGIMKLPEADLDSGALHVLAFRMRSRWAWLYHALRATAGRLRAGKHLAVHRAEQLRVTGHAAPFQVDGDYGGETAADGALEFGIMAERVRLFAPR